MNKTAQNKRLGSLLAALLLLCAFALPAFAEDDAPQDGGYTYTITLSAGAHAAFEDGSDVCVYPGRPAGGQVSLEAKVNELNEALERQNSKYYVLGVRLSGHEELMPQAFGVQRDEIYVVAYGIRGAMVDCTIRYVDAAGNPLAASRILRANVGDKPIVPYAYIEGYEPQAYNLTKTISENPEENVFTFVYTPAAAPAAGPGDTETVYVTVDVPAEPGVAAPGGAVPAPGGAAAGPEAPAGPGAEELPENPTPLAPQEVLDLDEQQTPSAGPGDVGNPADLSGEGAAHLWMVRAGLAAAILLVLLAAWLLFRRRGQKAKTQQD